MQQLLIHPILLNQLANLIPDADKLSIDKLEATRVDLSKPSNVVKT